MILQARCFHPTPPTPPEKIPTPLESIKYLQYFAPNCKYPLANKPVIYFALNTYFVIIRHVDRLIALHVYRDDISKGVGKLLYKHQASDTKNRLNEHEID